jgi:hypothetical protein
VEKRLEKRGWLSGRRRFLIRGERDLLRFSSASAPLLSDKVCPTVEQKITLIKFPYYLSKLFHQRFKKKFKKILRLSG